MHPRVDRRLSVSLAALAFVAFAPACGLGMSGLGPDSLEPGATAPDPASTTRVDASVVTGSLPATMSVGDAATITTEPDASVDEDAVASSMEATTPPPPSSTSSGGSGGCGAAPAATGTQSLSLMVNGKTRTYLLSVPANYQPGTPEALVFGYQGIAGSGRTAQATYGLEAPPTTFGQAPAANDRAIFVYPDALVGANPADPTTSDYDDSPDGVDFAFFDALVETLSAGYCVDPKRVFVTGLGGGGTFTNLIGCHRGGVVRAIAPVTSSAPASDGAGAVQCQGHVAVWIAHGENDMFSSFTANGVPARDFWLAQNGCSTSTVTDSTTPNACVDYQGCDPGFPVDWCVHDEGHNWPSTSPFVCLDAGVCFDAGPAIWSFFSSF